MQLIEDEFTEFKSKLNDSFEKEVISFLNANGGNIYIGIDDAGKIVGVKSNIDLIQRQIKDRLKDNILPSCISLFRIGIEKRDNKDIVVIKINKGNERPYYLKGSGMTPEGCFIRVGSSVVSMTNETILHEFSKRARNSLKNIKSPKQDLEFKTLMIYYQQKGYEVSDNFLKQLNLYNEDNEFNYIAYLVSDNNNLSIQFAKYSGTDVEDLIENENYGDCSLLAATDNILNKIKLENRTFTKILDTTREEIQLYNFDAVKEVITNAMIHNDWSNGYSPKFEIFSDKIVISSNGGIQEGITQKEFLKGFSNPKNPELMRIFHDLNFVEQLGTGIRRVLKKYDESIFEFFPNHIRVSIPFKENTLRENIPNSINKDSGIEYADLSSTMKEILKLLKFNSRISQHEIALLLGTTERTVQRNFKILMDEKYIERVGSKKNGYWQVLK